MVKVWVVSWCNEGEEPTVTVFSNREAAYALFENQAGVHAHLCLDLCEVYSKFMVDGRAFGE